MKYIITIVVLILVTLPVSAQEAEYTCPDGYYKIGDGDCKAQPTGCPYGDSIPLDSPKCAPTVVQPTIPETPVTDIPDNTSEVFGK